MAEDKEVLKQDVKQDDEKAPVGRWCVVANIVDESEFGEQHTLVKGSKHFSPGAKVYCGSVSGVGWGRVGVVGRHRGSRKFTCIILDRKYLHNYRATLEYSPHIQRLLSRYSVRLGGFTDASHKEAVEYAEYWNGKTLNEGLQRIIKRYTREHFRIRPEEAGDIAAISHVTQAAFANPVNNDAVEHLIIDRLRTVGALTISLVAEHDEEVVGHIAFSPVMISGADGHIPGWYGLGPMCVAPEHQRRGIGRALMKEGIRRLENIRAEGCVLVGDPAFYCRFGFANRPGLTFAGISPENLLARRMHADKFAHGEVRFHPAFETTA